MNKIEERPVPGDERRLSRVETVYRKIKSNILSNEYPAGFQILEPLLAHKLGVSRTPVREALIRLEADKLIELIPRRGMKVLASSPSDINDGLKVLESLELLSVELYLEGSDQTQFAGSLSSAVSEMLNAAQAKQLMAWFEAESQFRSSLAQLSKNKKVNELCTCLRERMSRAQRVSLDLRGDLIDYSNECANAVDAIASRDLNQFKSVYSQHCDKAREHLMKIFDKYSLVSL